MRIRMKSSKSCLSLLTVITFVFLSGFSGLANAALTVDQLMAKVREFSTDVANTAREREAAFRTEMEKQRKLAADTLALRNAAEARSNNLIAEIEANKTRQAELEQLLEVNKGNLGELFGVTRQIAGDAAGEL